jgi:hypothetical protein
MEYYKGDIMNQIRKYGVDNLGNIWVDFAQIDPIEGLPCYNPTRETLEQPPVCPIGKRLMIDNGSWIMIPIPIGNVRVDDVIRPKDSLERIRDGLDEPPIGWKLVVDDLGKLNLEEKTLDERLKSKEITVEEYTKVKNSPSLLRLKDIDDNTIRALREWIVAQTDCPDILKSLELEAIEIRKDLI